MEHLGRDVCYYINVLHHIKLILLSSFSAEQYTVSMQMTMAGVTPANFGTLKEELTDVLATSLRVPSSSVDLSLVENTVASRSISTVIVATVKSSDANAAEAVKSSIGSGSFKETLNDEISNSEALQASGVVMNAVSEPKVLVTNNEEDGIGPGKVYINEALKNFI